MGAITDEDHERDEIEEAVSRETCVEVIEPTKLEFNDDILSIAVSYTHLTLPTKRIV